MGRGRCQHGEGEGSAWADLHTVIGEVMTWWEGRGGVCVCVGVWVWVWVCGCVHVRARVVCINCGTILSDPIILCVRHRCISNSNSE